MRFRALAAFVMATMAFAMTARAEDTPSDTAKGSPSYLCLHVTYKGFTDASRVQWVTKKAQLAFEKAFAPITVVETLPNGEVAMYDIVISAEHSRDEYHLRVTLTQVRNPLVTPATEEKAFHYSLDPIDVEEFFREAANVFAKVVRITETPRLVGPSSVAPPASAALPAPEPLTSEPAAADGTGNPSDANGSPSVASSVGETAAEGAVAVTDGTTPPELDRSGEKPHPPMHWQRFTGIAVFAIGLISMGIGVSRGLELQSAAQDARSAQSQVERAQAQARGRDTARGANIAFGVGGGLATVGASVLALDMLGLFDNSEAPPASLSK
ncbi:MAG: hypothetical protein V1723_04060 [Candidatus Uhrbacteria bacterium]